MDPLYKEARERVGRQVASMEAVRKALLKQYDDFYKIRIFSSSDIFNEFRHSFREPGHSIVLLDFRPMEVFIDGHLKWARHPNSRLGGVVHIEPEVLAKRYFLCIDSIQLLYGRLEVQHGYVQFCRI